MSKMELKVTSLDGEVLASAEFEAPPAGFTLTVNEGLPERSPLHPEALNMADLKVGMTIQRYNVRGGRTQRDLLVIGEPFRRTTSGKEWVVPVVTTDYCGRLRRREEFLADMGVTPYERSSGNFWNSQNYTLAVSD